MKWAFLLGSPDISGGTYVIFEHAIRAKKRGIDVTIITEKPVDKKILSWHSESLNLSWSTHEQVKNIEFDVAIATWWKTVFEIHRITAKSYVYFVQSIESRFYDEKELPLKKLIESTYVLPFHFVTEARWISKYLAENYNQSPSLVRNGIRKDIYKPDGEKYFQSEHGKLRVLIEGPLGVPFKNVEKTIELCKKSLADEIWLLTLSPISSFPGVDRVFSRISIFDTAKVYRSCDVLVKLSYVEGMFGPPLEMFHCGGTAITYDVTGHDEYMVHNYNSFIVKRDDNDQVISFINKLKTEPDLLNTLKQNALKTANNWPDWDTQASEFMDVMSSITKSQLSLQPLLEKQSKILFDWYVLAENYRLVLEKNQILIDANSLSVSTINKKYTIKKLIDFLFLKYSRLYKQSINSKK